MIARVGFTKAAVSSDLRSGSQVARAVKSVVRASNSANRALLAIEGCEEIANLPKI